MPASLWRFILTAGRSHQIAVAFLSIVLFLTGTVPLEIQRQIINAITLGQSYSTILLLVGGYLGLVLLEGLTKLALNIYRGWIGEVAVRWLRASILAASITLKGHPDETPPEGVRLSIVLSESEDVGSFVGASISEPLLQAGILVCIGGYMIYLQPPMALTVAAVFLPQVGFVPWIQSAINRRVANKVSILRQVSETIFEHVGERETLLEQRDRVETVFSTNMSIYKLKFSMNFFMNLLTQIGYAGIFALGGYYVVAGHTEIGTVVAFVSGLSKLTDPWNSLVDWYRDLRITQVKYALVRDAQTPLDP
ncbi:ABC transporter transmembrane domain-containing protein [Agrobacterium vitis]|uniref:ABC transporter transmembrane domain-containing protein n=1 Tax=Agrobacterium vitis TaxID=373 RepID=UPI003D26B726